MKYIRLLAIVLSLFNWGCKESNNMNAVDYVNYFDDEDEQALVAAILKGDVSALNLFSIKKINLDCIGKYELTPLRIAIKINNPTVLEQLLDLGANPNFRTKSGIVAAKFAVEDSDPIYTELLLKSDLDPNIKYDDRPILFYALENQHWQQFDLLIEYGADALTAKTGNNATVAIMLASMFEYERLKKHILAGGDFNTESNTGLSVVGLLSRDQIKFSGDPEHSAYIFRVEILQLLQEHGVDLPPNIPGIHYPELSPD